MALSCICSLDYFHRFFDTFKSSSDVYVYVIMMYWVNGVDLVRGKMDSVRTYLVCIE